MKIYFRLYYRKVIDGNHESKKERLHRDVLDILFKGVFAIFAITSRLEIYSRLY